MKSKLWFGVIIIVVVIFTVILLQKKTVGDLLSPHFTIISSSDKQTAETKTEIPASTPNAPTTYNFDASTDLKKEWETINPQVEDSDFESL